MINVEPGGPEFMDSPVIEGTLSELVNDSTDRTNQIRRLE